MQSIYNGDSQEKNVKKAKVMFEEIEKCASKIR